MIVDIPNCQLAATLEAAAASLLERASWTAPPVDAVALAGRLGIRVVIDRGQTARARIVRPAAMAGSQATSAIVVRCEDRHERTHWSVAYEIGESAAGDVFSALGIDPVEAPAASREAVANAVANRLLLPGRWFAGVGDACDWDLMELKARFATASHELIAMRMLDFLATAVFSVFDNGRLTWRRRPYGRPPPITPSEDSCRRRSHATGQAHSMRVDDCRVVAWPIHETDWKREIVRLTWPEVD